MQEPIARRFPDPLTVWSVAMFAEGVSPCADCWAETFADLINPDLVERLDGLRRLRYDIDGALHD